MKDLVLYIVKELVTNPDAVTVEEQRSSEGVNLMLTVDPADMGIVIGKGGQTIKSIRKLLIVRAMAEQVRVNLQIVEPEALPSDESGSEEVEETKSTSEKEKTAAENGDENTEETEESENNEDDSEDEKENESEAESEETPEDDKK